MTTTTTAAAAATKAAAAMPTASKDNSSGADSDAASAPAAQPYTSHAAKRPGARRYNTTDSLANDNTSNSTSQLAQQHHAQHHHRAKHAKHVVGGGITARIPMHARNPSAKALHKHTSASTTKLASKQHRQQSPSPDRSTQAAVTAAAAATSSTAAASAAHRRSTSDVKLPTRDSSSASLRKNASHSSLVGKRNRSHVEIAKKSKSAANIKRSASHRDVNKARGPRSSKGSVHFALGDNDGDDDDDEDDEGEEVEGDGQEDEWVDASGSASPYLSRRGSVASGVQSPGKAPATCDDPSNSAPSSRPHTPKEPSQLQKQQFQPEEEEEEEEEEEDEEEDEDEEENEEKEDQKQHSQQQQPGKGPAQLESSNDSASDRETIQHKEYLTSRLLKRTPSYSAPHTSKETAVVQTRSSPDSVRASLYGTPKNSTAIVGSDQTGGVTSRFVNGPGGAAEPGSFYTPIRSPVKRRSVDIQRPQSSGNLGEKHRHSVDAAAAALVAGTATAPASGAEDDSALAPRAKRPARGGAPAETSRTQQKLNLQRASSTMEPSQPVVGSGGVAGGSSSLVGVSSHEGKDLRISRQLERTGMEYLVVRRYQNPIARSIARLSHLPGAAKTQQALHQPKSNGSGGGGGGHAKKPSYGLGQNTTADSQQQQQQQKSRPTTPGAAAAASAFGGRPRPTSIKTNGANASRGDSSNNGHNSNNTNDNNDDDATARYCGDGASDDAALASILRNLWDKNMDLSASQD